MDASTTDSVRLFFIIILFLSVGQQRLVHSRVTQFRLFGRRSRSVLFRPTNGMLTTDVRRLDIQSSITRCCYVLAYTNSTVTFQIFLQNVLNMVFILLIILELALCAKQHPVVRICNYCVQLGNLVMNSLQEGELKLLVSRKATWVRWITARTALSHGLSKVFIFAVMPGFRVQEWFPSPLECVITAYSTVMRALS